MKHNPKKNKKQKKEPQKLIGSLGGQISELGYGTLESAKDHIQNRK